MSRSAARRSVTSSLQQNPAFGRQLEASDHPERRRLAAARRSQHDEKGAILDHETRILDGDEALEDLVQPLDADLRHGDASLRKVADDDEPERAAHDRDERISVEIEEKRLRQH
jgi:hypothetical protein